jgi:hypothetical protein
MRGVLAMLCTARDIKAARKDDAHGRAVADFRKFLAISAPKYLVTGYGDSLERAPHTKKMRVSMIRCSWICSARKFFGLAISPILPIRS